MPCRALEAFRQRAINEWAIKRGNCSLNALSGIGGVQTTFMRHWRPPLRKHVLMPCRALEAFRPPPLPGDPPTPQKFSLNALSGIGGVQTHRPARMATPTPTSLNALSGIGGVQTGSTAGQTGRTYSVLMPCRALEAFRRPTYGACPGPPQGGGLNALSGIGGVQTYASGSPRGTANSVLMPCRALEAFRRRARICKMISSSCSLNALSGIGGVQTFHGDYVAIEAAEIGS